ncbi:hypothetical protein ES703_66094 [subsurface metagenome]
MVDRKGTDEAKQAAREARRRRERRSRYEKLLEEHPAVKTARAKKVLWAEKMPSKPGIPKLIAERTEDSDAAARVTAVRRVMRYHRRASDLIRRQLRREMIYPKEHKALIRQGENIELDFREMIRSTARAIRTNPSTEAYATAIALRLDDTEFIDNLPLYLTFLDSWSPPQIRQRGRSQALHITFAKV